MVRGESGFNIMTVCMVWRCQCNQNWMTSRYDSSLYDLAGSIGSVDMSLRTLEFLDLVADHGARNGLSTIP